MEKTNYNIKRVDGTQMFTFTFWWIDTDGEEHREEINSDMEVALTIMGLLSGEICLADLEP